MNLTGDVLILLLGGLLVLSGIIGGGFEIKEIKIPKIGTISRILASIAGIVLIFVGVGMRDQASQPATSMNSDPPSLSTFSIFDNLGEDQVSEQVRILIDGKEVGTLTVSEDYQYSGINVTVPTAGRHGYDLEATAKFRDEDGRIYTIIGGGQGSINVSAGKVFELTSTIIGSTWMARMEER